uniref:Uncharacterized protein n=1 Tax=viral metagenome TaxID=1070528 RepID=A0A6H1ZW09_9ZZZZ
MRLIRCHGGFPAPWGTRKNSRHTVKALHVVPKNQAAVWACTLLDQAWDDVQVSIGATTEKVYENQVVEMKGIANDASMQADCGDGMRFMNGVVAPVMTNCRVYAYET